MTGSRFFRWPHFLVLAAALAGLLAVLVPGSLASPRPVSADDPGSYSKSWDGGGGSSYWGNPANWEPDGLPGPSDNVYLGAGPGVTIASDVSINWLHSHRPITMSGGSLSMAEASLIDHDFTLDTASTLTGAGDLTITGLFTWGWGTMSGTGATNCSGGVYLAQTANGEKKLYRTLNNKAGSTATYAAGASYFYVDAPGVFNNESGAVFDWETGVGGINNAGPAGTFNNAGTLVTDVSAQIATAFNNTGTVSINGGTLSFAGGYAVYTQTAGEIRLNGGHLYSYNPLNIQGGSLTGAGTVTAVVTTATGAGAGTVSPGLLGPGILNVTGNYAQGAGAALSIEIGGTAPGSGAHNHDQVNIAYDAALAGTLDVSLSGGFAPALSDTFTIMTFGSHTGTFAAANLPALGGDLAWANTIYNSGSVVLKVTARWDINRDGTVNYKDLAILGACYGTKAGDPGFNPKADLKADGAIDYKDLAILGAHYGDVYGGGSIGVMSNPLGMAFTLTGPANYSGTTPQMLFGAPAGDYTITWDHIAGYVSPASQTMTLTDGGSITFTGYYVTRMTAHLPAV